MILWGPGVSLPLQANSSFQERQKNHTFIVVLPSRKKHGHIHRFYIHFFSQQAFLMGYRQIEPFWSILLCGISLARRKISYSQEPCFRGIRLGLISFSIYRRLESSPVDTFLLAGWSHL